MNRFERGDSTANDSARKDTLENVSSGQLIERVSHWEFKILSSEFIIFFENQQKRKYRTVEPAEDIYMPFSLKTLNSIYSYLRK